MKKFCLFITVFIIAVGSVCAQRSDNPIPQIDNVVNSLVRDIHRKLVEERATKVVVSQQFLFNGSTPQFTSYWVNQITSALSNVPNKPYILLSEGPAGADFRISGEIVEAGNIIRVYTRLIRQDNRAIAASFQSDIERNAATTALLAGGRSNSAYVPIDDYEPDSWERPVTFEISADENTATMPRTINENDEDFFLLLPNKDGRLVMETTGNTDTFMEFYDANTRRMIEEDDDSGQENNARIVYNVEAGKRYIVKVRGYNDEVTGHYAFRAFFRTPRVADNSWENPIRYDLGGNRNTATEVNRNIYEETEDFFLLIPNITGRLVMETMGNTDTYMEFYDANNRRLLEENDDGGEDGNARISYNVEAGRRYIVKVRGYSDETTGRYTFHAYITPPRVRDNSWENPLRYQLGGTNQNAIVLNRLLEEDEEDFFLIVSNRSGIVVMETTGDNDTIMEFYDANNKQLLENDDDSGEEYNARITYNIESGKRYIVKVRTYGGEGGSYGFRAWMR